MKFNWKKIGGVSLAIASSVFPAVRAVEDGVKAVKDAKGSQGKQDAALELVREATTLVLEVKSQKLVDNPKVQAATRVVIDAVVALQNVLAEVAPEVETAAAPEAPAV